MKSFSVTQLMDEARHQEVFRKRAIAGGGLLHASPGFEWALKSIIDAPTHTMGTFLLNLLGEGLVLTIFRSGEMIAKTHVDKEIFRRCLQDEARHVSYGVLELKNYLDHAPDREKAVEEMHRFADVGEQVILTSFTEAALRRAGSDTARRRPQENRSGNGRARRAVEDVDGGVSAAMRSRGLQSP